VRHQLADAGASGAAQQLLLPESWGTCRNYSMHWPELPPEMM
jgi:hypothetical protein